MSLDYKHIYPLVSEISKEPSAAHTYLADSVRYDIMKDEYHYETDDFSESYRLNIGFECCIHQVPVTANTWNAFDNKYNRIHITNIVLKLRNVWLNKTGVGQLTSCNIDYIIANKNSIEASVIFTTDDDVLYRDPPHIDYANAEYQKCDENTIAIKLNGINRPLRSIDIFTLKERILKHISTFCNDAKVSSITKNPNADDLLVVTLNFAKYKIQNTTVSVFNMGGLDYALARCKVSAPHYEYHQEDIINDINDDVHGKLPEGMDILHHEVLSWYFIGNDTYNMEILYRVSKNTPQQEDDSNELGISDNIYMSAVEIMERDDNALEDYKFADITLYCKKDKTISIEEVEEAVSAILPRYIARNYPKEYNCSSMELMYCYCVEHEEKYHAGIIFKLDTGKE